MTSDDLDKREIEKFVVERILPVLDEHIDVQLERDDRQALRGFLQGVIANDRDSAFVALFPRVINAESALRQPVSHLAKRCPGGIPSLLDDLKKHDPKADKSLGGLSLLDSLRAARWILGHLLPTDAWSNTTLQDSALQEISRKRNIIAHGKDFQPHQDWQPLAQAMLDLFMFRSGIINRYEKLSAPPSEPDSTSSQ